MSKKKIRPAKLSVAQWALILIAVNRQMAACECVIKSANNTPYQAREYGIMRDAYVEIVVEIDEQLA